MSFDEDDLREAILDEAEKLAREWIEEEAGDGHFECDCGSTSFDIETWTNPAGGIEAAGVCRECNTRVDIEVDDSDIEELR